MHLNIAATNLRRHEIMFIALSLPTSKVMLSLHLTSSSLPYYERIFLRAVIAARVSFQYRNLVGRKEVKSNKERNQLLQMASGEVQERTMQQYLDVFRVRGRPLELSENQYKVAGAADSDSPASLVSLIYQNQAEAEQHASSTAPAATQLTLYHNPYWVRSLQLAQPLMPFGNRPYYDMPNRFKTCEEQIGKEVE